MWIWGSEISELFVCVGLVNFCIFYIHFVFTYKVKCTSYSPEKLKKKLERKRVKKEKKEEARQAKLALEAPVLEEEETSGKKLLS